MSQYIITMASEPAFGEYLRQRNQLREQTGHVLYGAAATLLNQYQAMQVNLAEGGPLAAVSDYHTAVEAALNIGQLITLATQLVQTIDAINAAVPGAFPTPQIG
jgi:hypothetical protein